MKQLLAAWLRSSRAERMGTAVLSVLLLALILVRFTAHHWVHSPQEFLQEEQRLQAAYAQWQAQQGLLQSSSNAEGKVAEASLFFFDPNTLDSEGFIRLGMPQRAVRGLMNWRRKGKHFYKPEDLKPLYNLPPESYARLSPFIRIDGNERQESRFAGSSFQRPEFIDLNTADSATLDRFVPGIGPVLAHKIVERRRALGGFLRHEQLLEVYKFPDSTFQKLKAQLRLEPTAVHKLELNAATAAQLGSHPYIGEKLAQNIVLYREGIGGYQRIEQLRQAPLMNEEIYRKIAPYLSVGNYAQSGSGSGNGGQPNAGR
jgi:DNA uptake protein ComE-like DNA-binding protein